MSDRTLRGLVRNGGAETVGDIFRNLAKQPQCCRCLPTLRDLVRQEKSDPGSALPSTGS